MSSAIPAVGLIMMSGVENNPSTETMMAMAEGLGVDPHEVLPASSELTRQRQNVGIRSP
jgi:hypothetical protein